METVRIVESASVNQTMPVRLVPGCPFRIVKCIRDAIAENRRRTPRIGSSVQSSNREGLPATRLIFR